MSEIFLKLTVLDYAGKSPRASQLNPPMTIYLLDVKSLDATPKVIVHGTAQPEPQTVGRSGIDILQGLSGLFAGTEYEGLGSIAPMAKLIDDRHVISRLREKSEEQNREIEELKRQNGKWQQKYETAALLQDFLDKVSPADVRKLLLAVRKQPSVVKKALKFL